MLNHNVVYVVLLSIIRPGQPLEYQNQVITVSLNKTNARTMARTYLESEEKVTVGKLKWERMVEQYTEDGFKWVRKNSLGETWTVEVIRKPVVEY